MAKQTVNFNLNKDDQTDFYDVIKVNENTDKIDTILGNTAKFETAGGTGTSITLTGIVFEDGNSKTFIVSANNSGADTTINDKNLYKPGTTKTPTLTAGKAVTVWYDLSGDCFFIKASADGDTIAENVLAGKTFSNDNDTGLVGTMPNYDNLEPDSVIAPFMYGGALYMQPPQGYYNGGLSRVKYAEPDLISENIKAGKNVFGVVGKNTVVDTADAVLDQAYLLTGYSGYDDGVKKVGTMTNNGAVTITPGASNKAIPKGYHSGAGIVQGDADLVAANILSGKNIFGVAGSLVPGKKFASGTVIGGESISFILVNGSTWVRSKAEVSMDFGFTPTRIILLQLPVLGSFHFSLYATGSARYNKFVVSGGIDSNQLPDAMHTFKADASPAYVNSNGFCLPGTGKDAPMTWLALE